MPPGSGKTVVGLEIARRLARPTLVLGPNTAIQAQWLAEWAGFAPSLVEASSATDLTAPITALTYQGIAVLDRPSGRAENGAAEAPGAGSGPRHSAYERRRARLLVARGGDRDAVLGLLHRNGRAIVERLAAGGPCTLVLDECHHLLDLWGHVLEAILDALHPESAVVGLTATPPGALAAREAALYRRLFGRDADFEIVTPAVVKDGYLAPYQELALLTRPTATEQRWIVAQQQRFDELLLDLLDPSFASVPFGAWFEVRIVERRSPEGAPVAWGTLERDDPALARAAIRWRWSRGAPKPPGAHVREEHRRALEAADWIALLDGYVHDVLHPSTDAYDAAALARIRRALPSIGYVLTRRGIRASTPVVDRVLGLSASKAAAAVRILEAERDALGDDLRAVVLTDFETVSREARAAPEGVLDPRAGSAAGVLRALLDHPATVALDPVLVSGRTVACSRATAPALVAFARADPDLAEVVAGFDPLAGTAAGPPDRALGWEDLVVVDPVHPGWTPRRWVPLVTAFFEAGGSRCLVGTRALLGEGWNSPRANVLVDLGAATTSASVQQVRGRTLRLDPSAPGKVADNWDVVCVAEGHLRGTADYERFVRKHRHYFALGATGEIESGVSHVDPSLGPFGPPPTDAFETLASAMLARPAARAATRSAWRIGEPYRDVPVETVRVRLGRSPGLPGMRLLRLKPGPAAGVPPFALAAGGTLGAVAAAGAGLALGAPVVGALGALGIAGAATGATLAGLRDRLSRLAPSDTLEDMGRAVADALAATGLTAPGMGAPAVRVAPQPDGYYRCYLEGSSYEDARRFAVALEQLVVPLWDPRWLIPRRVDEPPASLTGTAAVLLRRALPGRRGSPEVWHAVPDVLASRKDRVAAFEAAWSRWVSPGARALRADDPRAEVVLAVRLGDDPFRVETQLRTLWT